MIILHKEVTSAFIGLQRHGVPSPHYKAQKKNLSQPSLEDC